MPMQHKKAKKDNKKKGYTPAQAARICSISGQLAATALPLFLFFLGALVAVKRNGNGATPGGIAGMALSLAVFLSGFACWLTLQGKMTGWKEFFSARGQLIVLLLISLALRLPQLNTMPYQDYGVYYGELNKACAAFELTPGYFLEHMRMAAHPSYVYSILGAIPEFFFPGNYSNSWIMQTTISLLAVAGVYNILRSVCRFGARGSFTGALAFSVNPMFLGLDAYLQLDFGLAAFFFMFVWAFFEKKLILLAACAASLVLTKEFGITLLAGFVLGLLLYYFVGTKGGFGKKLMAILQDARMVELLVMALAGGLAMVYYLLFSGKAWVDISEILQNKDSTRLGYIGIDPAYIGYKIVQLLVMNFDWLLIALLVVSIIAGLCAATKKKLPQGISMLVYGGAGAAALYFAFSCIMVTYTVPRYNLVLMMTLSLYTIIAVLYNFKQNLARGICLAVSALLAVQGYFTIDPVMKLVYPNIQTGSIKLVYTNYKKDGFVGDYSVYNYQYSYVMPTLQKLLAEQGFAWDADVFFIGNGRCICSGTQERYNWDSENKRLCFQSEKGSYFNWNWTAPDFSNTAWSLSLAEHDRAIFVLVPSEQNTEEYYAAFAAQESVQAQYTNFVEHTASDRMGGKLYYWTAQRI